MCQQQLLYRPGDVISSIFANAKLTGFYNTGSVAQWIEQQPSKLWVTRSNRVGVTYQSFLTEAFLAYKQEQWK